MKRVLLSVFRPAALAFGLSFLAGCPETTGNNTGGDTTAPTFAGILTVTAQGMTRAVISWNAATDDVTAQANIVYEIFMATIADPSPSSTPAHTTGPGETSIVVSGLPVFQTTNFLVQARDEAGNVDGNTAIKGISLTTVDWDLVDGGEAMGINDDYPVWATAIVNVGGSLYAMWNEYGPAYKARVKLYNGNDSAPEWSDADAGSADGLNWNPAETVHEYERQVSLTAFNNHLYVAWPEWASGENYAFQLRVASHDPASSGAGWTFVERADPNDNGINMDPLDLASNPVLFVAGGKLRAVWLEEWTYESSFWHVRAAEYSGSDDSASWSFIDGGGETGLNVTMYESAYTPDAAFLNGHTVVAWIEDFLVRVRAYDGTEWTTIDGGGLNFATAQDAENPSLAVAGGRLYAAWVEYTAGATQVRVAVFSGDFSAPSWSFVDGGGATGANVDTAEGASWPDLVTLNEGLILFMSQSNGATSVVRARAFSGNLAAPAWHTIDGGSPSGLNFSQDYNSYSISAVEVNDRLYATWVEDAGVAASTIRVIVGR